VHLLGFVLKALGIHEQMTLPAANLLAAIVSPLLAAHPVVLDDCESTMPALG